MKLYGGRKTDYRRAVVRIVEDAILITGMLLVIFGVPALGETLCILLGVG